MDKEFEHTMPTWNSLAQELNCSSEQQMDGFMNLNWNKSADQYSNNHHFDSVLSSMGSSPVATDSAVSNDSFALRELIGKLGRIGNSNEIASPFQSVTASINPYAVNKSTSSSCFSTPLNSPPNLSLPMMDQIMNENLPNVQNSMKLSPALPAIPVDPGFAERAARFSRFGSRSFNGRTSPFGLTNAEMSIRSNEPLGKIHRVSSSPSLKQAGSPLENKNTSQPQMEIRPNIGFVSGSDANSHEESSVSEQVPGGETGSKASVELNYRKRKAVPRGKAKDDPINHSAETPKDSDANDDANAKRSRPTEGNGSENYGARAKSNAGDESKQKENSNQKPPEPPKDYIHVRARRGQATDSHSLAERVRREKISERMKFLQDLVPGCNKVTGKALMLDEIINYVQALQRQVEFLSMKLVSVNPRREFGIDNFVSKDMFQQNVSLAPPICPLDSSVAAFYGHQPQQTPQLQSNTSNGSLSQCSVDPLDATLCCSLGIQLPSVNEFGEGLQLPSLCEDDLQTILHMGFNHNHNQELTFHSQGFSRNKTNITHES